MGRTPRTQAQRREATIRKLVHAAVDALADVGYARSSVSEICSRAGVSHGGMFRHFPTRVSLVAAATAHVGRLHIEAIDAMSADLPEHVDPVEALLGFVRDATRTPTHAAWHEVMVAARTDPDLRSQVSDVLADYEAALHAMAVRVVPARDGDIRRTEVAVMSFLHMFDSEAVTRAVYANVEIEEARLSWAAEALRHALGRD
jgi:AcrR family transcriptional regulator